jgi:hypothetical protein
MRAVQGIDRPYAYGLPVALITYSFAYLDRSNERATVE